ncbi:MAG: alpha/beta hydrolase fold domain-containing protein [Desulfovibrio sp.]|nr:alpha/beta hydrolase fold domain-containing protein [Desulfovibrio sp.]
MRGEASQHLDLNLGIADLLGHPALGGAAIHLLPTPEAARSNLQLKDIARLMPWHNHVRPGEAIQAINHLIDEKIAGKKVFYSFYRAISLKERTGLFHFRGKPGAPFALICSGGGFRYVGTLHEGLPFAHYLGARGIHAFALQYRPAGERAASRDLAQALGWIFRNAQALEISTRGYSVWGASAGGRMAANLGSYGNKNLGGEDLPQPGALVLAYTGRDWICASEPPTFAIAGSGDSIAPAQIMTARTKALQAIGVDAQILVARGVGHGFGLGTGTAAEGWIDRALDFWLRRLN